MKICFYALREYDELDYVKQFSREYGFDYVYTTQYPDENNMELARGCEAVSVIPCDMSAPVIEKFHSYGAKYIINRCIGYDHIDMKKARELGMRVTNVSYPPDGVANYAIMLMLMCLRNFNPIMQRARIQDYTLKNKIGKDITDCTVGVIGTGRIGTTIIKHLSGFGCRILAYDPYQNAEAAKYAEYTDVETIYEESDVITLHMNANDSNYHMICKETIDKMKDGVVIINTARGKLIDSYALIEGIECGKVGGAGLDVLEDENGLYYYNRMGESMNNRALAILRSFPNVILSPHTAFYTTVNVSSMVRNGFEALDAFIKGIPTEYDVTDKN